MARIHYFILSGGGVAGGQKMAFRHVEALRDLGFDAVCYRGVSSELPTWFEHRAPVIEAVPLGADDIVVIPDDAAQDIRMNAMGAERGVILAQNPYYHAAVAIEAVTSHPTDHLPPFLAAAPGMAATLKRLYPKADVQVVPPFADERLFRPGRKAPGIACVPRKRPLEASVIRNLFLRLHQRHAEIPWRSLHKVTEAQVAATMGASSLFLSLSRLESVGMTALEAMASGCLCAGFLGVGGREFGTAENGFWVADDDCVAAADALAEAADLVATGGPRLAAVIEAGHETARQWSYARFTDALETAWMRLAPEARIKQGPLDS